MLPQPQSQADRISLWERGALLWKLHAGQYWLELAFRKSAGLSKLFVADCSRQLGKSTWGTKTAVEKAQSKPGSKIRYATAFLTDLEQFIVPAFDFILADCPAHLAPKFNGQKSEYRFPNGSKIRLVGLDRKPNGLRGNKLDLAILDECGYMSRLDYLYRFVLVPATTHVPDARIIMMSTQPETPDHDFVKYCDRAEALGCYVKLDVFKNPLLGKDQIDELAKECGGYGSTAFRREYLCERVVEEGRALIPEFNEQKHVAPAPISPAHHFWIRLEALDSGVRDQTAWLCGYYDFIRAKLVIEDEFAITGSEVTTRRISELVMAKEALYPHYKNPRRVSDNDNLILLQDLGTEFKLHFAATNKDELPAMVNKVRLWFMANRIEIHPRCKRLIACLKAGIWNKLRDKFDRSDVHGHYDLIAALVYMVRNVPETENPVPHFFNQNLSEVFISTAPQDKSNQGQLQKGFGLR